MKTGQTSDNAIEHVAAYVDNRLAGANKQESALLAEYSPATARNPSLIEATKAYAVVIKETLGDSSTAMRTIVRYIIDDTQTDVFKALPTQTKVEIAYKMAKIYEVLTPKVTVKESTDGKGNKTRTIWGTGGAQPSEN